jgi:hypothetical protein
MIYQNEGIRPISGHWPSGGGSGRTGDLRGRSRINAELRTVERWEFRLQAVAVAVAGRAICVDGTA